MAVVVVRWTSVLFHLGTSRGVTKVKTSLFKASQDDSVPLSERRRKEIVKEALKRDDKRREKEKGNKSPPFQPKRDLHNMEVHEG